MEQNLSDPVIDEIREVRRRISARFAHDPAQLVAYYMELQKQYQDRLIETTKQAERTNQSDAYPSAASDRATARRLSLRR
jgi:hypothetical protein